MYSSGISTLTDKVSRMLLLLVSNENLVVWDMNTLFSHMVKRGKVLSR